MDEKIKIEQTSNTGVKDSKVFSWALFSELGIEFALLTAAPLLIFIFLGPIFKFVGLQELAQWANENWKNSATYKITGLFVCVIITFSTILKKIKDIEKLIKK